MSLLQPPSGPRDAGFIPDRKAETKSYVYALEETPVFDQPYPAIESPDWYREQRQTWGTLPIWWTIDAWGFEQLRTFNAQSTRYLAPSAAWKRGSGSADLGAVLAPNVETVDVRTTHAKLRIEYNGNTETTRVVDLDIGAGIRISILSSYVAAFWLLPAVHREKLAPRGVATLPVFPADATLVDCQLAAKVSGSWGPIGSRVARFSEIRRVISSGSIPIPPAARTVQIWQNDEGTAAPSLEWRDAVAASPARVVTAGRNVGVIDFEAGQRRTAPLLVPGSASHITATSPEDSRLLMFVWELEL